MKEKHQGPDVQLFRRLNDGSNPIGDENPAVHVLKIVQASTSSKSLVEDDSAVLLVSCHSVFNSYAPLDKICARS